MPQLQLPIFPSGVTHITPELAFRREGGTVTFFNGFMPVFQHGEQDLASFKMIVSQFYVMGVAKQSDLVRAFGVSGLLVKRAVKQYREEGSQGFFAPRKYRGAAVLTTEVCTQAQELLDQGETPSAVAHRLGVKVDTLSKAVRTGRLRRPSASGSGAGSVGSARDASCKSERSAAESDAEMGVAATNVMGRVAASLGLNAAVEVAPQFTPALDVAGGGVLLALPALLAVGLLRHTERHFTLPQGYYTLYNIFLLLAFLALGRVKSLEQLRREPPGEWGKLLGLDRIPEVKTLREKVKYLAEKGEPFPWSAALCRDWMNDTQEQAQLYYVDGHVRVYHGSQTALPKHYVSRQRLCLRATVDYWVNAMDGQPFFVVPQDVDPGLIAVLEREILPRLLQELPGRSTPEELAAAPLTARLTVVFDREGYSPALMARLWRQRVAVLTYRKRPGDEWPVTEFASYEVRLVGGELVTMLLAERGVFLGGMIWVREIRRLTTTGHQTAIVTTHYEWDLMNVASTIFARWCQENFFAYMRRHYGLDHLISYDTEEIPDTTKVINPDYRRLESEICRKNSRLVRVKAQFGELGLEGKIEPERVEKYETKKAALYEELTQLQEEVTGLKARRKETKRHITCGELPEEARFQRLARSGKHFIDTVKMVAYRSETAMAHTLGEHLARADDVRALLCAIYTTAVDLFPDPAAGTLTVRLHRMASRAHDTAVAALCEELTATETVYPGTNLRLVYELVSSQSP